MHALKPTSLYRQTGFTLIEVMLVVVIIGFMAAMATLAIGGNHHRTFQNDVQRLHQLLLLAQDRATFEQQSLGLRLMDGGYEFMSYSRRSQTWASVEDKPLYPREFELPTRPQLNINGVKLVLKSSEHADEANHQPAEKVSPDLLILANGEISAFELVLQLQAEPRIRHRLYSDGFSAIRHELLQ